jgi:Inner membrane protein YgaP-like, transmembrane domain
MTIERWIRVFAGSFVLLSLSLGAEASPIFVSRYFLWFTAFVGANLLQSAFTGFCPLATVLRRAGVKPAVRGPEAAPGA